ncbi:TKL protein kinase [Pelomyxa schiedti]|nr:TKL protein kinase [Pelomyxa schiedti]
MSGTVEAEREDFQVEDAEDEELSNILERMLVLMSCASKSSPGSGEADNDDEDVSSDDSIGRSSSDEGRAPAAPAPAPAPATKTTAATSASAAAPAAPGSGTRRRRRGRGLRRPGGGGEEQEQGGGRRPSYARAERREYLQIDAACSLWDASCEASKAKFMVEKKLVPVLLSILTQAHCDRLLETVAGLLANIASTSDDLCLSILTECPQAPSIVSLGAYLTDADPPTLTEITRFILVSVSQKSTQEQWLTFLNEHTVIIDNLMFILKNTLHQPLLTHSTQLASALLYTDPSRLGVQLFQRGFGETMFDLLTEHTKPDTTVSNSSAIIALASCAASAATSSHPQLYAPLVTPAVAQCLHNVLQAAAIEPDFNEACSSLLIALAAIVSQNSTPESTPTSGTDSMSTSTSSTTTATSTTPESPQNQTVATTATSNTNTTPMFLSSQSEQTNLAKVLMRIANTIDEGDEDSNDENTVEDKVQALWCLVAYVAHTYINGGPSAGLTIVLSNPQQLMGAVNKSLLAVTGGDTTGTGMSMLHKAVRLLLAASMHLSLTAPPAAPPAAPAKVSSSRTTGRAARPTASHPRPGAAERSNQSSGSVSDLLARWLTKHSTEVIQYEKEMSGAAPVDAAATELWEAARLGSLSKVQEILGPVVPPSPPSFRARGNKNEVAATSQQIMDAYVPALWDGQRVDTTALYIACQEGRADVVDFLVAKGANVEKTRTDTGATPLYVACANGFAEIAEVLLTRGRGADANKAVSNTGATPLHVASQNGHVEVVKVLVTKGGGRAAVNQARTDTGATPLHVACSSGHCDVVEFLVTRGGAEVDRPMGRTGMTPLHVACENGGAEVVDILLSKGRADANKPRTDNGATPLWVASQKGHVRVVNTLLTKGNANANRATDNGETPLWVASRDGHIQVVDILVTEGADVNKARTNDVGSTPLEIAGSQGRQSVVNLLICCGASIPRSLIGGTSPLVKAFTGTAAVPLPYIEPPDGGSKVNHAETLCNKGAQPLVVESKRCLCSILIEKDAGAISTAIVHSIKGHKSRQGNTPILVTTLDSVCDLRNGVTKRPSKRFSALSFACQIVNAWLEVSRKECSDTTKTALHNSTETTEISKGVTDAQSKATALENEMQGCKQKVLEVQALLDNATLELKTVMTHAVSSARMMWWLEKEKEAVKKGLDTLQAQLNMLNQVVSNKTLQGLTAADVANLLIPELHLFNISNTDSKEGEAVLCRKILTNDMDGVAFQEIDLAHLRGLGLTDVLHMKAICYLVESVLKSGTIQRFQYNNQADTIPSNPMLWSEAQVREWLGTIHFFDDPKTSPNLTESRLLMPGWMFVHLTEEDMTSFGLDQMGRRIRLKKAINELKVKATSCNNIAFPAVNRNDAYTAVVPRERNPKEQVIQVLLDTPWEHLNLRGLSNILTTTAMAVVAVGKTEHPVVSPTNIPEICCYHCTSSSSTFLECFIKSIVDETAQLISDRCGDDTVPKCARDKIFSGMMEGRYLPSSHMCPSGNIILLQRALEIISKHSENHFPDFIISLASAERLRQTMLAAQSAVDSANSEAAQKTAQYNAAVVRLNFLQNSLFQSEEKLRTSVAQSRAHREFLTWLYIERDDIKRELDAATRDYATITSVFARKSFAGLTSTEVATLVIPEMDLFSWSPETTPDTDKLKAQQAKSAKENEVCELFESNMIDGEALDHLPDDEALLSQLGIRDFFPRKALRHFIRRHVIGSPTSTGTGTGTSTSASTPRTTEMTTATAAAPPFSASSSPPVVNSTNGGTQQPRSSVVVEWTPAQVEAWFKGQLGVLLPQYRYPGYAVATTAHTKGSTTAASSSRTIDHARKIMVPPGWAFVELEAKDIIMVPPGWAFVELEAKDIVGLFPQLPIVLSDKCSRLHSFRHFRE